MRIVASGSESHFIGFGNPHESRTHRGLVLGFRSIESATLAGCGRFNVLIGKNNSGKSNLLLAVRSFFDALATGELMSLRPHLTQAEDFFDRRTGTPISITCTFSVSKDFVSALVESIVAEFPQISNVAISVGPALYLHMTVKYFLDPAAYSVLSAVAVSQHENPHCSENRSIILDISDDVSSQLFTVFQNARSRRQEARASKVLLDQFDDEDYELAKADRTATRMRFGGPIEMYLRRAGLDVAEDFLERIKTGLRSTNSVSEFQLFLGQSGDKAEQLAKDTEKLPVAGDIATISGRQHSVPSYVLGLCRTFANYKVLYQSERRDPIGPSDADRLLSMRVKRGGDKLFRAFQANVAALIGVDVEAFAEETDDTSDLIRRAGKQRAQLDVDNFLVQANGSGIKEALRLMLNIELDNPDIMLIEEPEVHLHPALESAVMRYLHQRASGAQIFLTTHSTNFVDSGEYSAIHLVRKVTSTDIKLLTIDDARELLPRELGLRPSALLMFEKLVFVEGASDEDVLRQWAATLDINLSRAGVGFVLLGGSRNIRHFAAHRTVEFLCQRGVELWFILDRDEKEPEDLVRIREAIGHNCRIEVLPAREVENFLVAPRPLLRLLEARASSRSESASAPPSLPTEDDLRAAIDECAESLRDFSFAKALLAKCGLPAYIAPEFKPSDEEAASVEKLRGVLSAQARQLEERANKLDEIVEEIKIAFTQGWKQNKLNVVPGDELLRSVLGRYGVNYKKHRDAKQIAAFMETNEIPEAVNKILSELAPREIRSPRQ